MTYFDHFLSKAAQFEKGKKRKIYRKVTFISVYPASLKETDYMCTKLLKLHNPIWYGGIYPATLILLALSKV